MGLNWIIVHWIIHSKPTSDQWVDGIRACVPGMQAAIKPCPAKARHWIDNKAFILDTIIIVVQCVLVSVSGIKHDLPLFLPSNVYAHSIAVTYYLPLHGHHNIMTACAYSGTQVQVLYGPRRQCWLKNYTAKESAEVKGHSINTGLHRTILYINWMATCINIPFVYNI